MATLVTTKQAAEILGVDRSTITRWVKSGRIEPAQIVPGYRGQILFDPDELPEHQVGGDEHAA